MRKLFTLLFLALLSTAMFAQTEDFESCTLADDADENNKYGSVPEGWSRFVVGDVDLPNEAAWTCTSENALVDNEGDEGKCMKMAAFLTAGADFWLVTKKFSPNADGVLEIYVRDSDWAPDNDDDLGLDIFVSTSEETPASPEDFEAEPIMIIDETDDGEYWDYQIDLSAYVGQNVYVGFRVTNANGMCDGWWLDNIDGLNEPVTTGIGDVTSNDAFTVFPNPTKGIFTIKNTENADVTVYSIIGKEVVKQQANGIEKKIDLSKFEQGTYIVRISAEGNEVIKKVNYIK